MIGVLTAAASSGNVLGYDFGDMKNKDQLIEILAYEGVYMDPELVDRLNQNWTDAASKKEFKRLSRNLANDLSKQFDAQSSLNDRIVKTTGHIALPFSPADRPRLKDKEFKIHLAKEYMEEMGITDTQYVITEHKVPEENAPHLHIAYNRVRFDGTVIDSRNERYRSQKIARKLSEKYGLTPAGKTPRHDERLSEKQQKFARMRTLAIEARSMSGNIEEFRQELRKRGIQLQMTEHSGQKRSYGLSYSMTNEPEISAKGSKLDRNALSYAKVAAALASNMAAQQKKEEEMFRRIQEQALERRKREQNEKYNAIAGALIIVQKEVWNDLKAAREKAYKLYLNKLKGYIELSKSTTETHYELLKQWQEFTKLNETKKNAKTVAEAIEVMGGMLMLLNPIVGLLAIFFSKFVRDISELGTPEQKQKLLPEIKSLHEDFERMVAKKKQLSFEKKELLNQYLIAKDRAMEYKTAMRSVDNYIKAISKDLPPQVVWKSEYSLSTPRILKIKDDEYILQNSKPAPPVVNGRYTGIKWSNEEYFADFKVLPVKDSTYDYILIKKNDGSMDVINQFGVTHGHKIREKLGIDDNPGGPSPTNKKTP
jgi:hypothetical protein